MGYCGFDRCNVDRPRRANLRRDHLSLRNLIPARFIFREQLGGRSPAGLFLAIDIREGLGAVVPYNEASGRFFDRPGREASHSAAGKVRHPASRLGGQITSAFILPKTTARRIAVNAKLRDC